MIGSCELKARVEESLGTVLDPDFFGQAEQYARRKLDMCNERAGRIYGEDGYGDEYLVLLTASCAEPGEYNHNRRENGQHDTERRTGRRDRVRTSGYEGHAERGDAVSRSEEAVKKWAEALDIPEDQALPCVVAFACLRYHGKSFVRKLANGTGPITTWQSLKIGVALFLWGRAQKKDPWGELYRITKFAQAWKEGDSI